MPMTVDQENGKASGIQLKATGKSNFETDEQGTLGMFSTTPQLSFRHKFSPVSAQASLFCHPHAAHPGLTHMPRREHLP